MSRNVVIEGMEVIIKRDLDIHRKALENTKLDAVAFREARQHEVRKKSHYVKLISEGKFNEKSMQAALTQIDINIRAMSDKEKLMAEKTEHHQLIVDTLSEQLSEQNIALDELAKYRRGDGAEH